MTRGAEPRSGPAAYRAAAAARAPAIVFTLLALSYAWLGLYVLRPESLYSGDIGVKFVQARALAASHFTSLAIPYPGEFLDPVREFFAIRPPFVMTTGGSVQAIFSPASAVMQAIAVALAGIRGMIVVSLAAALAILLAVWRLADPGEEAAVLLALGVASPIWFYAVSGWEHAPAVAFGTAAFAIALRSPVQRAPLLAGLCLGAGATLRDEVILLAPGLLLAVWWRGGAARPLLWSVLGMIAPLGLAAAIEVWWFERPVAAHLRHAVHLLQSVFGLAGPNPDVPALRPFTLRERYDTVVRSWLLGYGRDAWIAAYGAGLAVALAIRYWLRSSLGLLAWTVAVVALAAVDLHELVTAPKWLAGLHRVSPYLVLALFPLPLAAKRRGYYVPLALVTAAVYLALAFAGADTSGGKALGPRLLLPIMPLLTVAAVSTLGRYLTAERAADRWVGRAGALLVVMSAAMHLLGTVPAYVERNRGDSQAILSIASRSDRLVVADDEFTAQLLFPLYYRKIVFVADSPERAHRLAAALSRQRLTSVVLVSRQAEPAVRLTPYRLDRSEQLGRLFIEYWRR